MRQSNSMKSTNLRVSRRGAWFEPQGGGSVVIPIVCIDSELLVSRQQPRNRATPTGHQNAAPRFSVTDVMAEPGVELVHPDDLLDVVSAAGIARVPVASE
jgi:hypothetical protein